MAGWRRQVPESAPGASTIQPVDHGHGVVELVPFTGDRFEDKRRRRFAVVKFVAADQRTFLKLMVCGDEPTARKWLGDYLQGGAAKRCQGLCAKPNNATPPEVARFHRPTTYADSAIR
jgi:hypothetical protein